MEEYLQGVMALNDYFTQYNQGLILPLVLSGENQAFLNTVTQIVALDMPADAAYFLLSTRLTSPAS